MLTIVRDFHLWRVQACPITSETLNIVGFFTRKTTIQNALIYE